MIRLRNVEKVYEQGLNKTYVLRRVDMDVREGEFVSIMGPSGAGKSTLLAILGMFDSAWTGEFYFADQPTPTVLTGIATDKTSQRTNGFGKSPIHRNFARSHFGSARKLPDHFRVDVKAVGDERNLVGNFLQSFARNDRAHDARTVFVLNRRLERGFMRFFGNDLFGAF